jgi:UDP-2-acetamido-3-amino-2,3-dideoxy-glucuronate N-acetyltransferase
VSVYDGVVLEDDVFVGPSVVFTNVNNPRSEISRRHAYEPTHVGVGATIGANATIVCGVILGPYSMVGAGSTVTNDVAPHGLVIGSPARLVAYVCRRGHRLVPDSTLDYSTLYTCPTCREQLRVTYDLGELP